MTDADGSDVVEAMIGVDVEVWQEEEPDEGAVPSHTYGYGFMDTVDARRVLRAALEQVSDEFPANALNILADAAANPEGGDDGR